MFLFTFGGKHLHLFADVVDILLNHFERLAYTSASYFQFIVLFITVQVILHKPAQCYTILYPHSISMVYLHYDFIVWADRDVHQEIIVALQPLVYNLFYDVFIYHKSIIKIKLG